MKAFLLRICFLSGISMVSLAKAAQQINWYSPTLQTNLTGAGAVMDGTFQFQLGAFASGFVPTASNASDWAANWSPAATTSYVPASNVRAFEAIFSLTSNGAPFSVGAKAYVWGRSSGSASDEWILFRASSWTWPSANPSGAPPNPLDWSADLASEVILGTVHGSGSPFLMKSETVRSYQQWKSVALSGQVLDAPLDDPDHDGVPNLLEFLFGTSPVLPNSPTSTPTTIIDISGQKYLQISIPRLRDRLVSVTVQVSSDLVTWQSGSSATVEVSDTPELLVVRDLTPVVPGLSKRFMRVKAVSAP
ncbi:MAG: hypothetical protein EOP88_10235 [Verrucomicrobiaceae bacterium]|nr:MAG: hypothetical protein EOP88_10235 [Verrucomicrobiaceae bacterium]